MIAIRVGPRGRELAGLAHWEGDTGAVTVPVAPARPAGYTREDAEREGFILPENPTDADRELASLRRVRHMMRSVSEENWRRILRESDEWSWMAELEEWSQPPRPDGVPFDVAERLVADGYAEFVEVDQDELEAELERWTQLRAGE